MRKKTRKYKYPDVLKRFIEEHFCFESLIEIGFFKEEDRDNYELQAHKICTFFGYENVFEYGSKSFRVHLSFGDENGFNGTGWTGTIKSIYE